jgi:opacity protein-like surface antigen
MKRFLAAALAAALVLSAAAPAAAAPAPPSGTIVLDTAAPAYGQPVTFTTSVTGHLKGYQYPLVYVACSQDVLVYGQLDYPDAVFILGGGSSLWVTRGGGAADCIATLYIYPGLHDGPILWLASTAFHAAG